MWGKTYVAVVMTPPPPRPPIYPHDYQVMLQIKVSYKSRNNQHEHILRHGARDAPNEGQQDGGLHRDSAPDDIA